MRRFAAALAASYYLRSSAPEGSAGLGMLSGLAQSWTTAVLCTLPFMANRGNGRGEEGDRHSRGPALLRLTWDQPTSAFLGLAPSAGSDCLEWSHSDSHAPEWGSLLMMVMMMVR